jgi:hypothetical protein
MSCQLFGVLMYSKQVAHKGLFIYRPRWKKKRSVVSPLFSGELFLSLENFFCIWRIYIFFVSGEYIFFLYLENIYFFCIWRIYIFFVSGEYIKSFWASWDSKCPISHLKYILKIILGFLCFSCHIHYMIAKLRKDIIQ